MSRSRAWKGSEVAVIGMSCRFPGAGNIDRFWRNVRDGVEPDARVDPEDWAKAVAAHPAFFDQPEYVKARPRLEDVDLFDAAFFGYSPREAQILDPQQRLFLECSWEALEDAGYDSDRVDGAIGVCAGVSQSTYLLSILQGNLELEKQVGRLNIGLGNMNDSLATRVAYKLNLTGPAFAVQCFCSTSLVAVHLGCRSLLSNESDMILAGGVTIVVPQEAGYQYQEGGILSPDGHTRTFDAQGRGMVFGNGLGIVVLKRLKDALEDGDNVRAVILGSAINNDGSLKVGYTAPSVVGQSKVIQRALEEAGVDPETISYVEAHGTATNLGDPAEIAGLTKAYRRWTDKKAYCAIGSVKTNIGHLDASAGVAGLIKTVLALEHKQIPPSLHFETPNPEIDFEGSPFYVNARLTEWSSDCLPRRSGVSSFGFGGTNAHAVLEEAPPIEPSDTARPWQLFVLSAKTTSALDRISDNLAAHLTCHSDMNPADVAYTLQIGRKVFNHRRILVCRDQEDARAALTDRSRMETVCQDRANAPVAFMFSGQGSQYVNMGKDLMDGEPVFREEIDRCSELLRPHLGLDLRSIIYPGDDDPEAATEELKQTRVTQPALFVIEYALARLWMSRGVEPAAMIGHSIGEYVAAHLAGVFSLEGALAVVAERGRLMQSLQPGSMLAIPLSENDVQSYLGGDISLAGVNAPSVSVVSGPTPDIERLESELAERGVMSRRLHTSHAFHSSMMDPILESFTERVGEVELQPPRLPFVSNVTGTWIQEEQATIPSYWAEHLRRPVRFSDGVRTLMEKSSPVLLEVGPGNTLATLAKQGAEGSEKPVAVPSMRHPKEDRDDRELLLIGLGRLWLAGVHMDWPKLHAGERRRRVSLPTYPFERRRHWVPLSEAYRCAMEITRGFSARRREMTDWFYQPSWQRFTPPENLVEPIAEGPDCWLIFTDELGVGRVMAKELADRDQTVVTAAAGDSFGGNMTDGFILDPKQRADYAKLVRLLVEQGKPPTHIAHLWCLTGDEEPGDILDRLAESQTKGFYSLLYLAQALGGEAVRHPLKLAVVTNGMQDVVGGELTHPEKATVLGPCLVMNQELENVACRSIDVQLPPVETAGVVARRLIGDLTADSTGEVVAYRGRYRWVFSIEPSPLESSERPNLLRRDGVYLITGGAGGIGLALARHLAAKYHAKLILTGRSPLPPREEWAAKLESQGAGDALGKKIQGLLELEAQGADVMYVAADVASERDMQEVVRRGLERFGTLNGAIHAAGVPGGGIIQLKEPEEAARVLAPKVQGTLVLESVLKDVPLDFLLLCSSTAALAGVLGQVDYCGANAFLDAYARRATGDGGRLTISIDWDTWKDVGMAVETPVSGSLKAMREISLKLGIAPSEGAEAFERIVNAKLPQVAVFPMDVTPKVLRERIARRIGRTEDETEPEAESTDISAETTDEQGPVTDLERMVRDTWTKVLGIRRIGVNDNFFELGGDSLTALQVISLLKNRLGEEIPVVTFYESPTVGLLAEALGTDEAEKKEVGLEEVGQRAQTRLAAMERRRRMRRTSKQ